MNSKAPALNKGMNSVWVFLAFWVLTFVVYVATSRAGWVIDGLGFLYNMKHQSFSDFINTTNSADKGFYQLYALHYYIFYQLWGMSPWMWGILYITMHALNAYLLFSVFRSLLSDSSVQKSFAISLAAVAIYTISPHISEVMVWKACFHYLLAFQFILLSTQWVQKYQHDQKGKYMAGSVIVFILAAFTNAIFYLLPFFVLIVACYYRLALGYDKKTFRKTLLYFFLPQIILLGIYFLALYLRFGEIKPHKTEFNQSVADYLSKPIKYLFHIIFLGRYFTNEVKDAVYSFCESIITIVVFYGLLIAYFTYNFSRLKKLAGTGKVILVLIVLVFMNLFFLLPLAFPDSALLVFFDRYLYFVAPFVFLLVALIAISAFKNKYVLIGLLCIYIDCNLFFTIKVNTSWMDSDEINNTLIHTFPNDESKTVLLLNNPENMNGAPMIGAQPECMFRNMREIYTGIHDKNLIYDVAAYNLVAEYNGAHVNVKNDSVIRVTLNHTGTWWWYEGHGAKSYETPDYKVYMGDPGRWYELNLKHPHDNYLLLYSVADKWRTVDMNLKDKQQD